MANHHHLNERNAGEDRGEQSGKGDNSPANGPSDLPFWQ
jgi:hypothetical protein